MYLVRASVPWLCFLLRGISFLLVFSGMWGSVLALLSALALDSGSASIPLMSPVSRDETALAVWKGLRLLLLHLSCLC